MLNFINYWPVFIAYLVGGILGGRLVGRLRGVDLRAAGSGNIGATNALRTQGKEFALAVLMIDAGKGVLTTLALPMLATALHASHSIAGAEPNFSSLPYLIGAATVIGHCFSPWAGFNGGKGVATLTGVLGVLLSSHLAWMFGAFVLTILLSGMVSLATLVSVSFG